MLLLIFALPAARLDPAHPSEAALLSQLQALATADKKEEVAELEEDIADSLEDISELEQQLKPLVDERANLQANLPDLERTAAADELALIDADLAELERTTA